MILFAKVGILIATLSLFTNSFIVPKNAKSYGEMQGGETLCRYTWMLDAISMF